ncbi:unnamed protein product, partial [marine sediment metagenome]
MAKILFINPIGTDTYDEYFSRILSPEANPNTTVDVISFKPIDNNVINVSNYVGETINAIIEAEKKGFDAAVICCAGDPGLVESKRAVEIPVIGTAEAGLYGSSLFGKVAVITPSGSGTYFRDLARRYGTENM